MNKLQYTFNYKEKKNTSLVNFIAISFLFYSKHYKFTNTKCTKCFLRNLNRLPIGHRCDSGLVEITNVPLVPKKKKKFENELSSY